MGATVPVRCRDGGERAPGVRLGGPAPCSQQQGHHRSRETQEGPSRHVAVYFQGVPGQVCGMVGIENPGRLVGAGSVGTVGSEGPAVALGGFGGAGVTRQLRRLGGDACWLCADCPRRSLDGSTGGPCGLTGPLKTTGAPGLTRCVSPRGHVLGQPRQSCRRPALRLRCALQTLLPNPPPSRAFSCLGSHRNVNV